ALAPIVVSEPPANLDAGSEMGLECRDPQPDVADRLANSLCLDYPQSESVAFEVITNPRHHRLALGSIQELRQELHDARVGIERGERRQVGAPPGAKHKSRRRD